jgi:Spy/CpxP family protein refolding chaperone
MKRIYFIVCFIIFMFHGWAQPAPPPPPAGGGNRQPQLARIHAVKIGYLTDKMRLTPEQSEKFWPLYNQYEDELTAARKNFRQKYKGADKKDENVSRQIIDDHLDLQQQALELKRKYKDRFLQVITANQLTELYKAEQEFHKMLLHRLKQHRDRRNRWD